MTSRGSNRKKTTGTTTSAPNGDPARARDPDEAAAVWASLDDVHGWPRNPRKNADTIWRVVESLKKFGWGRPVGARRSNGELVWGHSATAAAHQLTKEWEQATPEQRGKWHRDAVRTATKRVLPVRFGEWSEQEAHALALADNRLQEYSKWDEDLLTEELGDLSLAQAHLLGWSGDALEKMVTFSAGQKGRNAQGDTSPQMQTLRYQVVVDVVDEEAQAELVSRLEDEGFKCSPLIL